MAVIPYATATGLVIGGLASGHQRIRSYFWPTTEFVSFQIWQFCSLKTCFWSWLASSKFRWPNGPRVADCREGLVAAEPG
jgi:hypothetical protein